MEEKFQLVSSTEFEEEEFYEEIEAPKFVDFTLPDHFCPDDRFWFCSRVGMFFFLSPKFKGIWIVLKLKLYCMSEFHDNNGIHLKSQLCCLNSWVFFLYYN